MEQTRAKKMKSNIRPESIHPLLIATPNGKSLPGQRDAIKPEGEGLESFQASGGCSSLEPYKYHGYGTLIRIALAFLLVFIGWGGTETLQIHINSESGLGTTAVAILYGTFCLSCFGFGPVVVGHFGPKWPTIIGWVFYILFVLANFYPRRWTLYTTAALVGFAAGPIWISMGVYTTSLALEHATINKKPREKVLALFNGIFIGIFFFEYPVSSLISSIVFFMAGKPELVGVANQTGELFQSTIVGNLNRTLDGEKHPENTTYTTIHADSVCGVKYCSYLTSHVSEIQKPDATFLNINLGIFCGFMVVGMLLLSFQRSVKPPDHKYIPIKTRMMLLIKVLKDRRWLLMAPTFAAIGIMQGMAINTFSQAFVNCTLDIRYVAYVLTLRGFTVMTTSFVSGKIVEWLPQWVLLLTAYCTELVVIIVWIFWNPTAEETWVFFVIQGAEGMGAGSLRVHSTALLGLLFPSEQEVAFAHLNMIRGLATCFIMALANFVCFGPQAYLALGVFSFSILCYLMLRLIMKNEAVLEFKNERENE